MSKTVQIDDDVMEAAEEVAAKRGSSAGEVISELARRALIESADKGLVGPAGAVLKNGWYVLPRRGGSPVTNELVQQLLDEADLEDAGLKRSG